jgi:hypothetical protein
MKDGQCRIKEKRWGRIYDFRKTQLSNLFYFVGKVIRSPPPPKYEGSRPGSGRN